MHPYQKESFYDMIVILAHNPGTTTTTTTI